MHLVILYVYKVYETWINYNLLLEEGDVYIHLPHNSPLKNVETYAACEIHYVLKKKK